MELQHLTTEEACQSKWSPVSSGTEAVVPAPSRPPRWRCLLASCAVTAGLVLAVGLAVMQPRALSQHRLPMTAALEEATVKESVTSTEKRMNNDIHQVEEDMKMFLRRKIQKDIDREIEADFEKDGEKQEGAKGLAKVEKDFEAELNQDVATDVEKHLDNAFGHVIKKDLESHLDSSIPKGAQSVEKKDDDKGNSSKTIAPMNIGGLDKAWCAANKLDSWALPSVPKYKPVSRQPVSVTILDWNLAWYEVYKNKGGEGGRQGKWLANSGPYDIIGFQECQNPWRLLGDGRLMDTYHAYQGGGAKNSQAICVLYKKDTWEELGHGEKQVAEDQPGKWTYFGKRIVVWFRLRHKETKENIMFVNHHGPLPLGSGGICGGHATAYNILEVIQNNSKVGDAIVLVGDFNAGADSLTMNQLTSSLTRCYSGVVFNGIDHFVTNFNVQRVVHTANLGGHGSDHDALSITFKLGRQ